MRDRSRARRALTAAASLTAAVALTATGCSGGSDGAQESGGNGVGKTSTQAEKQAKRPSPKPSPAWNKRPDSLAALGDSITRGFDACGLLTDCPKVSWATGTDPKVDSLARRLLRAPEKQSWNFARTGARVSDLQGQADAAIAHKPQLVTILIGANDACRTTTAGMTAVGTFRTTFAASLQEIRRKLPKTQVYVSSVPDLQRLWQVGKGNPMTKQIWKLGICQSMLQSPDATDQASVNRRTMVRQRVIAYNQVLKEECAKVRLCVYDGGAAFDFDFTSRHLSKWDFFHPNTSGQHTLAEIAFKRIERGRPGA
ncbi:MAG: SGNH/GDSL hydrolase family protein [Streptomyces sp.]|jgi:lysophospholipase L1-like esterase|nr:SGNH/GDSL hydrolase family protein [Streptomyces sp.]